MRNILFYLLFVTTTLTAQTLDFDRYQGVWQNDSEATLDIQQIDTNSLQITGFFRSPSGTEGDAYPMIGWLNHKAPEKEGNNVVVISFMVRWGDMGSITSWTGYFAKEEQSDDLTLHTLWHLVRPNTSYEWDHILTNTDIFVKKE